MNKRPRHLFKVSVEVRTIEIDIKKPKKYIWFTMKLLSPLQNLD